MSHQEQIAAQVKLIRSILPPYTLRQMHAACDVYDEHAARLGDIPNDIAEATGWSAGTCCVIRRWSHERAAGIEPRLEVRL